MSHNQILTPNFADTGDRFTAQRLAPVWLA
jgi:hypothetical protein